MIFIAIMIFVIKGWLGIILLTYLVLEITSYLTTGLFLIRKILIYFRFKSELKKIIPSWWAIIKVSTYASYKRKDGNIGVDFEIGSIIYKQRITSSIIVDNHVKFITGMEVTITNIRYFDSKNGIDTDQLTKENDRDEKLRKLKI